MAGNQILFRCVEHKRLAYYLHSPDREFWDEHWTSSSREEVYRSAGQGKLGRFERWFTEYLPKNGNIIEAGCGLGHYVLALSQRGYDVEGVDWAPRTVAMVKQRFPNLRIRIGNVMNLDVPENYYSGYISLGVVEHRAEGPEPFLKEAFRILKPTGTAIITVPLVNSLRWFKMSLGAYKSKAVTGEFYQYAFLKNEFVDLVRQSGFQIVTTGAYDSYKGIFDEFPKLKRLLGKKLGPYHFGSLLQKALYKLDWIERRFGHMLLVVARKPRTPGPA